MNKVGQIGNIEERFRDSPGLPANPARSQRMDTADLEEAGRCFSGLLMAPGINAKNKGRPSPRAMENGLNMVDTESLCCETLSSPYSASQILSGTADSGCQAISNQETQDTIDTQDWPFPAHCPPDALLMGPATSHQATLSHRVGMPLKHFKSAESALANVTENNGLQSPETTCAMPGQLPGDRILLGLYHSAPGPLDAAPLAVDPGESITALMSRLAERILVADRSQATDQEVRIQLRDSVLQGTEIIVRRDRGQIMVNFIAPTAELSQRLQLHISDLRHIFGRQQAQAIQVEIHVAKPAPNTDSHSDGRSRNRWDPQCLWESEDTQDSSG